MTAWSLQPMTSFSDDDIRHLLVRTHFGVNKADYQRAVRLGVPAFVDDMMRFPPVGTTAWERRAATLINNPAFPVWDELVKWWLELMETNPKPFQEVMAFFWHQHFGVTASVMSRVSMHWVREHVDLLRRHALGNVRDLLVDVARDPAMLMFLDGLNNARYAPNENFAREFWELYTLGAGNGYTQADVLEASRAFTGYDYTVNQATGQAEVWFNPNRHDDLDKVIFGQTIQGQSLTDDFEQVVDITIAQRPVAEWVCRQLIEYFCCENPPQTMVDELASVMRDNSYHVQPVLRTLLLSRAFYSPSARGSLVREPIHLMVGFSRSTSLRVPKQKFLTSVWLSGQVPTMPPTAEGWPSGAPWLASHVIIAFVNFVSESITARAHQAGLGIKVEHLLPTPTATSADVAEELIWLLRLRLTEAERSEAIRYLDTDFVRGEVVASPFDPTNPTHIDSRLRGLIYILAQHPSYHIR